MPTLIEYPADYSSDESGGDDRRGRGRRASLGHSSKAVYKEWFGKASGLPSIKDKQVKALYDAVDVVIRDSDEEVPSDVLQQAKETLKGVDDEGWLGPLKQSLRLEIWSKSKNLTLTLAGQPNLGPLCADVAKHDKWGFAHILCKNHLSNVGETKKNYMLLHLLVLRVLVIFGQAIMEKVQKEFWSHSIEEKVASLNVADFRKTRLQISRDDVTVMKTVEIVLDGVGIVDKSFGNPKFRRLITQALSRWAVSTMKTRSRQAELPPPPPPKKKTRKNPPVPQPDEAAAAAEAEAEEPPLQDPDNDDDSFGGEDLQGKLWVRPDGQYVKYPCPFCSSKSVYINPERYESLDLNLGELIVKDDGMLYHRDERPIPPRTMRSGKLDHSKRDTMRAHHERNHSEWAMPAAYAPLRSRNHAHQDANSVKIRKQIREKKNREARAERFENGTQTAEDIAYRNKEKARSRKNRNKPSSASA